MSGLRKLRSSTLAACAGPWPQARRPRCYGRQPWSRLMEQSLCMHHASTDSAGTPVRWCLRSAPPLDLPQSLGISATDLYSLTRLQQVLKNCEEGFEVHPEVFPRDWPSVRLLLSKMITTTRRWLRRNRTGFAIGFGIVGIGYLAGQYVVSKITEVRDRMTSDRIAKEKLVSLISCQFIASLTSCSLRRRFQQNQEDCTITVLELLPTVTENVLEALNAERITQELQQKKAERLGRSSANSEIAPSELSSCAPSAIDEDGKSLSSESYIHASQVATSSSSGAGEANQARSKAQLWNELKVNCKDDLRHCDCTTLTPLSHYTCFHSPLHCVTPQPIHSYTTKSARAEELSFQRRGPSLICPTNIYDQS